jgi:beta-phosphoglucomutase family hydrolase
MIPWEQISAAEGVIFDCDGTLVDSMPIHYLAWNETMRSVGLVFEEDRFYALGGMPTDRIIAMLAKEQNKDVDPKETALRKEAAFFEKMHLLEPIEIIVDVARKLRGSKPIAVASGGFRSVVQQQLNHVGILDWFDVLVCAEDTKRHKPEPDVFLESAKRLGIRPEKCLVFEDADLGVEAAKRAGMACLDVRDYFVSKRIALPEE